MIKPTPPPKVKDTRLLVVSFCYATLLIVIALVQLMGLGGFSFAGINYETDGMPVWIIVMAAANIFALPFLLRLKLSPLARATSAFLCLLAPLLFLSNTVFMSPEVNLVQLLAGAFLGVLALVSFTVLDGNRVVKFSK